MEQKVKAGDYVILTDPLNYGKRAKVEEVNDDGSIVYDGGVTPLYLKEPKELDAIAHPDYGMEQAEMLKDKHDIDWEQRRYEIAKEMMPYCARELIDVLNSGGKNEEWVGKTIQQIASESAVGYADALIERLKGKEEQE